MTDKPVAGAIACALALCVAGASHAVDERPRLNAPGGLGLDSWLAELFATGVGPNQDDPVILRLEVNPIQREVARVVGVVCPALNLAAKEGADLSAGALDLRARCNEIVFGLVDDDALQGQSLAGLQAMGAEEGATLASTQVDFGAAHEADIGARMLSLRTGLAGPAIALEGRAIPAASLFGAGASGGNAGGGMGRWSFFIDASLGDGDKDPTPLEPGFELDSRSVTAGLDYRLSESVVVGAAAGYTSLEADLDADGGALDTDSRSLFLYGTWQPSARWYVDGTLGYTDSDHAQERSLRYRIDAAFQDVVVPGIPTLVDQSARSDNDSREWSASLLAGYDHDLGRWVLSPYGRLDHGDVDIDGYTERMADPAAAGHGLAVQIDDQAYQSTTLALGILAYTDAVLGWGTLVPQLSAEYVHELANDNDDITGRFVDALGGSPGTDFALPTAAPDRDYFNLGAGVTALIGERTSVYLQYQTLQGYRDQSLNELKLGLRVAL